MMEQPKTLKYLLALFLMSQTVIGMNSFDSPSFLLKSCEILQRCTGVSHNKTLCPDKLRLRISIGSTLLNESKHPKEEVMIVENIIDIKTNLSILLDKPIAVRILGEPLAQMYPLKFVKSVNAQPEEVIYHRDNLDQYTSCSAKTLAHLCRKRAFASGMGFCCTCDEDSLNQPFHIRGGQSCYDERGPVSSSDVSHSSTHCFHWHPLWYSVHGIGSPYMEHVIEVQVFTQKPHSTHHDNKQWTDLGELNVQLNSSNSTKDHMISAKYLSSVSTDPYIELHEDVFLLTPDPVGITNNADNQQIINMLLNEDLIMNKSLIDMTGISCDKVGVSPSTFHSHNNSCLLPAQSCLENQPISLWINDKERLAMGEEPVHLIKAPHRLVYNERRQHDAIAFPVRCATELLLDISFPWLHSVIQQDMVHIMIRDVVITTSLFQSFVSADVVSVSHVKVDAVIALERCHGFTSAASSDMTVTLAPYEQKTIEFVRNTQRLLTGAKYHSCQVVVYHHNERDVWRSVEFLPMDRCVCLAHCVCACLSSGHLKCEPLTLDDFRATGFTGMLLPSPAEPWSPAPVITILVVMSCAVMLALGCIKAMVGVTVSRHIGEVGLGLFLPRNTADETDSKTEWVVPLLNLVFCFYLPLKWLHWIILHRKQNRYPYRLLPDEPVQPIRSRKTISQDPNTPNQPLPKKVPRTPAKGTQRYYGWSEGDVTVQDAILPETSVSATSRDYRHIKRQILTGAEDNGKLENDRVSHRKRKLKNLNKLLENEVRLLTRCDRSRLTRLLKRGKVMFFNSDEPCQYVNSSGPKFSLAGNFSEFGDLHVFSTKQHPLQVLGCVGGELLTLEEPLPLPALFKDEFFTDHQVLEFFSERPRHPCLNMTS